MIQWLEQLSIHTEGVRNPGRAIYFFLTGGEWWPIHVAEGPPRMWMGRMTVYGATHYTDDSSDQGLKQWPEWAHAAADGTPSLDLEDDIPPGQEPPRVEDGNINADGTKRLNVPA